MNGLLAPGALIAGLLAIPILIVYMLRTRRPRRVVASTFLWREATRNVAASRPWDRIKPSILLLLQLLLLAALVLALARPYRSAPGVAGDHLVVVIDASGSMLATDVSPSRLGAAQIEAKRLIDTLSDGATISVVVAAGSPRVVIPSTQDRRAAARAIDDIQATEAPADFAEAFLMAESLELPGRPATIAVISDGGLDSAARELMPAGSVFRAVGTSADNVSVERLEVGETGQGFRALVAVRNFFDSERDVELALYRDGAEAASAALTVPGNSSVERSFDLGAEGGRLEARVAGDDALPADDRALAVLERDRPRRITLVTPGNPFLESLLSTLPAAEVEVTTEPVAGAPADLAIFDRVASPRRPETPALFIAPTALPAGVTVTGSIKKPAITYLAPSDPLLAEVDLSELSIARAQRAEISGSRTLVGTTDSPLIATWTDGTRRRAWVGFDLHESNLPVQVAFPILFDHLLSWLAGTEPLAARFAGDVIDLPQVAGGEEVRVAIPGGRGATLAPGESFVDTQRAGFYEIEYSDGEAVLDERTVALSYPTSESKLEPRTIEARPDEARPGLTATARRPVIAWVLAGALLLLLLEWWWAHGRPAPAAVTSRFERRKAA